jgi:hypothetical protein
VSFIVVSQVEEKAKAGVVLMVYQAMPEIFENCRCGSTSGFARSAGIEPTYRVHKFRAVFRTIRSFLEQREMRGAQD